MIKDLLLISFGGILGTCSRYIVSVFIESFTGKVFPLGTLLVNSFGALLAGLLFGIFGFSESFKDYRLFCMVGFLGAFTTFSAYSLETANLFFDGKIKLGFLNILLNNILSLVFVGLGFWLAHTLILKVD
jgi:fluoride exporter